MVDKYQTSEERAAIEWLAIELPRILNELQGSLSGLKHELKNLTREVEQLEQHSITLRQSYEMVRARLGLR